MSALQLESPFADMTNGQLLPPGYSVTTPDEQEKRIETLSAGTLIAGRYEIESLLGIGAMGCVYLARDHVLSDEAVALKVLHGEFAYSPTYAQRFLREVQLMRRIAHENVVRTYDVGADKDIVYFTMELVPGKSLSELFEGQPCTYDQVADLLIQIARGLEAIHAANIIHRDLKPENILVTHEGKVKITDFGVARPEYSKLTNHNEVIGSAGYMAPEVWLGKKLSHAIDLYSLGVLTYELLVGVIPFDADSPATLMRLHLDRQPDPIRNSRPDVPLWLNKLVMRLLAKTPQERPRSAREVIEYVTANTRQDTNDTGNVRAKLEATLDESHSLLAELENLSRKATELDEESKHSAKVQSVSQTNSCSSSTTREIFSSIISLSRSSSTQGIERIHSIITEPFHSMSSTFCLLLALLTLLSSSSQWFLEHTDPVFTLLTTETPVRIELLELHADRILEAVSVVFLLQAVLLSTPIVLVIAAVNGTARAFRTLIVTVPLLLAVQGWFFWSGLSATSDSVSRELEIIRSALTVRNNLSEVLLLNPAFTRLGETLEPSNTFPLYSDPSLLILSFTWISLMLWIFGRGIHRSIGVRAPRILPLASLISLLVLIESSMLPTTRPLEHGPLIPVHLLSFHLPLSIPCLGAVVFNWMVTAGGAIFLLYRAQAALRKISE